MLRNKKYMITTEELRQKYLDFFKAKGHTVIDGASLIPENDPTVLFTTSGMHPLVPFLLGEKHPSGNKLVNYQKCIRTGDIEEVGDIGHLTFFEMLGNWSFGEYFKKQAIEYSFEFLTSSKWLDISVEKLAVTVFAGDDDADRDQESAKVWKSLGIPEHKVAYLGKKDNWWGPAGQTGPCGPDSEMFYWIGQGRPSTKSNPGTDPDNWVEIWNDVFMQYNKTADGKYEPLQQKNVDTGMGLERVVMILNGFSNVYQVDSIKPIYDTVKELAVDKKNDKAFRIITDHIRAAVMIMGDDRGVMPSNLDQGYVVRRLIRTAIRQGRELGISDSFVLLVARVVIDTLGDVYDELKRNEQKIISELTVEEEKFKKAIKSGTKQAKKIMEQNFDKYLHEQGKEGMQVQSISRKEKLNFPNPLITGKEAFYLYSTYGIPVELIKELAEEKGFVLNQEEFEKEIKKHQELSQAGSEQKFSGGLADHSDEVKKLHTTTHLLHVALRKVLGDHVAQKGSNITGERLRFDFSHPAKMTPKEIEQVENIVNEQIDKKLSVSFTEMTVDEAKANGALGLFTQKYGDKVKVYTVGEDDNFFSRELCGGPHVENLSELGHFKITKEQASSAGVRRIKAVLE